MDKKEILKFGDVEIEKGEFHFSKNAIPIDDVNIDKVVISDEFPCMKRVLSILPATQIMKSHTIVCLVPKNELVCKNV